MRKYRIRKLLVATQAVENASPRCPHPRCRVKMKFSARFRATARKLTTIGVLRRSMA
jgi:hypothetical protein